tara:strand:+ start:41550 stop:42680 length:1131 start_codon:yes stop_codon:yes gene_type:complete
LLAGVAIALTGCVSAGDPSMFASQGFAPGTPSFTNFNSTDQSDALMMASAAEASTSEGIPVPVPSPASADAEPAQPTADQAQGGANQQLAMANTSVDALNQGITQNQPVHASPNLYSASAEAPQPAPAENVSSDSAQLALRMASADPTPASVGTDSDQSAEQPKTRELAVVAPPKKQSIFARLFASQPKSTRNAPSGTKKRLASSKPTQVVVASASTGNSAALPGVRMSNVFGISDSDSSEEPRDARMELASAAGLARLAPNGLRLQTEKVDVGCFKPELIRVLKTIERHYGRSLVVTSGYRSPKYNRRVGGASGSRHTSCEAADIQIEGVSKWQLAKYLRAMPNRGGVGTYCHTESVHIDIGTQRDWNWRCRRRK